MRRPQRKRKRCVSYHRVRVTEKDKRTHGTNQRWIWRQFKKKKSSAKKKRVTNSRDICMLCNRVPLRTHTSTVYYCSRSVNAICRHIVVHYNGASIDNGPPRVGRGGMAASEKLDPHPHAYTHAISRFWIVEHNILDSFCTIPSPLQNTFHLVSLQWQLWLHTICFILISHRLWSLRFLCLSGLPNCLILA